MFVQLAKKKAAESMLEKMMKAYPNGIAKVGKPVTSQRLRHKTKSVAPRKKPRNLAKVKRKMLTND